MLFVRGLIIGFSIAAPVGPIGVLCIRRSLRSGWFAGFISGLGAATADLLYGSIAAFGVQAVSRAMIEGQVWMRGLGGVFLIYLGLRTFRAQPSDAEVSTDRKGLLAFYGSTFALTLTNPLTIISFAAIFASINPLNMDLTTNASIQMVSGVFLGSSSWWLMLSLASGVLRRRMSPPVSRWIQWVSGAIIILFGIAALTSLAIS